MKLSQLFEMPLANITYTRDDEHGSFSDQERMLIKKYIEQKVYHDKLKSIPFDLYVYVLDKDGLLDIGTDYPEGEIKLKKDGERFLQMVGGSMGGPDLSDAAFGLIFKAIEVNKEKNPKGVHFIIGDNFSEESQINLTPWMLTHRFVHTLGLDAFSTHDGPIGFLYDELHKYDSKPGLLSLVRAIFHMGFIFKSARTEKADGQELTVEIATQYLLTGKNPIDEDALNELVHSDDRLMKIGLPKIVKLLQTVVSEIQREIDKHIPKLPGRVFYI